MVIKKHFRTIEIHLVNVGGPMQHFWQMEIRGIWLSRYNFGVFLNWLFHFSSQKKRNKWKGTKRRDTLTWFLSLLLAGTRTSYCLAGDLTQPTSHQISEVMTRPPSFTASTHVLPRHDWGITEVRGAFKLVYMHYCLDTVMGLVI